ncbi:hypothetical protein [Arthrobacter sp. KK5.5]|uniref:hypothetical protein n=1 Tax=Arthrobacter sp. KK5.5 TaxID=3373084 RepID=UPI003EE6D379
MKKSFALGAVLALTLTGCGATAGETESNVSVEPAASSAGPTTAASAPESSAAPSGAIETEEAEASETVSGDLSERGNMVKKIGDSAGLTGPDGETLVEFTVHSIEVDPKCTGQFAEKSENGHLLALDVSVATKAGMEEAHFGGWSMSPYSFKTIAPNGTTSNSDLGTMPTYSCLDDSEGLPDTIGDAEKARGIVILDVENPKGTLVFEDPLAQAGWEWEYPAE